MDVSHNPASVLFLRQYLDKAPIKNRKVYAVLGAGEEKDVKGMIDNLKGRVSEWFIAEPKMESPFKKEEISGFLLLIFAILAVIIVNSPLESFYYQLKTLPLPINIGEINLNKTTEHWVNDGLMAIFFFLIGLELKREIMEGELSSFSKMLVPGIAAVGGMGLPAAVYIYLNYNNPENVIDIFTKL